MCKYPSKSCYELRKNYNIRVSYIVLGMVLFSVFLLGLKKFIDRPKTDDETEKMEVVQIDLTPPPPIEETPPPPPPPPRVNN